MKEIRYRHVMSGTVPQSSITHDNYKAQDFYIFRNLKGVEEELEH